MTPHPRDDMDLDDQEQLFFQHLGPLSGVRRDPSQADSSNPLQNSGAAKRPRVEGPERNKGKGGKGKGKAKGKGGPPPPGPTPTQALYPAARNVGIQQWLQREPGTVDAVDQPNPKDTKSGWKREWTVSQRMVLRQEQTLSALRQRPDALPVRPERRAGHDPHLVPGRRKMAGNKGGDAGEVELFSQTSDVQAADDHFTRTAHRNIEKPTGFGPCQVPELGRSGGLLEDSPMEWGQAKPGDRHHGFSRHQQRIFLTQNSAGSKGHQRDLADPVQVHPTVDGGGEGRNG